MIYCFLTKEKKGRRLVMERASQRHVKKVETTWNLAWFLPVALIFMELVFRLATVKGFFSSGLIFILLFSLPFSVLLFLLCTLSKNQKVNYGVTIGILAFLALVFCSQVVYFGVFDTYYILYSVKNTGQILQFWKDIFLSILRNLIALLFLWLPVVVFAVFGKRHFAARCIPWRGKAVFVVLIAILHFIASGITLLCKKGESSPA